MKLSRNLRVAPVLTLLLVSAGCMVGPTYKRPSTPAVPAFKEQPPVNFKEAEAAGWKQSQPGDAFAKGRWWELYNDAALNALEEQVSVSNQNVLRAEAQYREAKAAVGVARAALFPVASAAPAITESRSGSGAANRCSGVDLNQVLLTIVAYCRPSSRALRFIRSTNASFEPAIWMARATAASLARPATSTASERSSMRC